VLAVRRSLGEDNMVQCRANCDIRDARKKFELLVRIRRADDDQTCAILLPPDTYSVTRNHRVCEALLELPEDASEFVIATDLTPALLQRDRDAGKTFSVASVLKRGTFAAS
jgi:hypothetical protein